MSQRACKPRRAVRRPLAAPCKSLSPSPVPEPALPCSQLLRLVSVLHLNCLPVPPRTPLAAVPSGYGGRQNLPRHASELRAIEGYHKLPADGLHSLTPSPILPLQRRPRVAEVRRSYESSRKQTQNRTFLTENRPNPTVRSVSVRSTYGFSESPEAGLPVAARNSIASYSGECSQGLRHGEGTAEYRNGDQYKGNWAEGYRYGYGEYRYSDSGLRFRGDWEDDLKTGSGVTIFPNGDSMECIWKQDFIADRTAVFTYSKAEARFEGEICKAAKRGNGVITYRDGGKYTGRWTNDRRSGQGVLTFPDFLFEGTFVHDSATGPGLLYIKGGLFLRPEGSSNVPIAAIPAEKQRLLGDLSDYFHFTHSTVVYACDIVYRALPVSVMESRIGPVTDAVDGAFRDGVLNDAAMVVYGCYGVYVGTLREGKRSGYGQMTYANSQFHCANFPEAEGTYTGKWRNDERHGRGRMSWPNGLSYDGDFTRDRRHNVKGVLSLPTGERYDGDWKHDLMHGRGTYSDGKGTVFVGEFVSGHPRRVGELRWESGDRYQGEVVDMQACGQGVMTYGNGNRYEGALVHGLRQGKGRMEYANGAVYDGQWREGLRQGNGVYSYQGETYSGLWLNDLRHGPGQLTTAENKTMRGTWHLDRAEGRIDIQSDSAEPF